VVDGMRVALTGATGFLGRALARALAQQGVDLHVLCRRTSDRSPLDGMAVTFHEGDVTIPESLHELVAGAEWIIHAAGQLGRATVPERAYQRLNVEGTRHVMAAALTTGDGPRVLHLSSPGVLGPTGSHPATEGAPYAPSSPYERSKAAAEQVALEFSERGLPVVIARPGFIYGPGDRHVLGMFRAVRRGRYFYIGGGRALCQPTFIDDAVAGMLACMSRGRAGEVYHLAGPRALTFREMGETIAAALGVSPPRLSLPRWPVMIGAAGLEIASRLTGREPPLSRTGVAFFSEDRVYSWEKARLELEYAPQHDLEDGVRCTVAWYRDRGWL
jgi:dihydroflavonol-4-reductase